MNINHRTACECPECLGGSVHTRPWPWNGDMGTPYGTEQRAFDRANVVADTSLGLLSQLPPPLPPEPVTYPRPAPPRRPRAAPPPRIAWPAQRRAYVSQREPRGASTAS